MRGSQFEEASLDPADGEIAQQLAARFNPRRYRLDVRHAPMMHVACAQEAGGSWVMMHLFHHFVLDHTALEIVLHEIDAHLHGNEGQLPEPLPFRNFVAQTRLGVSREEHEAFFLEMLADVSEPSLPFGLADVQGDGSGIVEAYHRIDSSLSKRLRACARRLGVSAASVCHVAWARVLSALCGCDDVVFGTVMFGRMQGGASVDRAMGLFMNTLPFRVKLDASVEVGVRRTHAELAQLMHHEHAPLALAQRCGGVAAPAPLFSALLNYRHFSPETVSRVLDGMDTLFGEERTNYPVTLSVNDLGENLSLSAHVDGSGNAQRTCEYMHRSLEELVDALERSPEKPLSTLSVLPEAERHRVVVEWNATEHPYRSDVCVHELFEEQVARTPDAVAVVYQDSKLTYAELDRQANQLAHHLRKFGVGPDKRVALCLERRPPMIIALLAILKAGGAYVPLDSSYPPDRLAYMLHDSAPEAVLIDNRAESDLRQMIYASGATVVNVDEDCSEWQAAHETKPDVDGLSPEHLVMVIYTSGSTGKPKGVMIEHRSTINRLLWLQETYPLDALDSLLQKAPVGFDVSVFEIFWPLCTGATLVLARPQAHNDPEYLAATISKNNVTAIHFVPSLLQWFLEDCDDRWALSVKRVLCSGELLPLSTIRKFCLRFPGVELHNLYGPTEGAEVTAWRCDPSWASEIVPIGRPIANTRIYILDKRLASPSL